MSGRLDDERRVTALLTQAVGTPPRGITAAAVKRRAARQRRRLTGICASVAVVLVGGSVAAVAASSNGHHTDTLVAPPGPTSPADVGGPVVSASPDNGLRDGDRVTVSVHGFPSGKVYLSECAVAAAANPTGCGQRLAAQPFLVADAQGSGTATFRVRSEAAAKPLVSDTVPCTDACVLVATTGAPPTSSGQAHVVFASAALSFLSPPAATLPPAVPATVPSGFAAASMSFPTAQLGWVLGTAPCPHTRCVLLLHTSDGGAQWHAISPPPVPIYVDPSRAVTARVVFADARHGWAFDWGGHGLYFTGDGGGHWSPVTLSGDGGNFTVADLAAAAGRVHAVVFGPAGTGIGIYSAAVDTNAWVRSPTTLQMGAGPVTRVQIVLSGANGWIINNDRTVIDAAILTGGRWVSWQPPCRPKSATEGWGDAGLAATSPTVLVAACPQSLLYGTPAPGQLWRSIDAGRSFTVTSTSLPRDLGASMVAPAPGTIIYAGYSGNIEASFDDGATWQTVVAAPSGQPSNPINPSVIFVSASTGYADTSSGALLTTTDGGHHWNPLAFTGS